MSLRDQFLALDDSLAAKGVPPLTEWWRDGLGRWLDAYETGHVLELWACAGRGMAKSTVLYKLALFFTLFGKFTVPIGERHYAVVLSRLKEEAGKGVDIIDRWLELLGIQHKLAGDVVELQGSPRGIRVVAASVSGSSGWRAYFVGKDERSKWPQGGGGVEDLDAGEIDASAAAMTATHPYAPVVAVGSAWGMFGEFHAAITSGDDPTKIVLGPAPTWVAAPHISEADTRRKEPRNANRWAREYACVFQGGDSSALDDDDVRLAIRPVPVGALVATSPIIITDASAGRGDSWTWCACQWVREVSTADIHVWCDLVQRDRQRILVRHPDVLPTDNVIHERATQARDPVTHEIELDPTYRETMGMRIVISAMSGMHGKFSERIDSGTVVKSIAAVARKVGARRAYGDQYSAFALAESFSRNGLKYISTPWGNELKVQAVTHLRTWLRDGTLIIEPGPEAEKLREECQQFQERLLPTGYTAFGARRGGHDDRVALLLLAAALDVLGVAFTPDQWGQAGSPMKAPNYRTEIPYA